MLPDATEIAKRHGFNVIHAKVLAERKNRKVVRLQTKQGYLVLKMDSTPEAFDTEMAMIQTLTEHELPVAKVIGFDEKDMSYLLLTWIEGVALSSNSSIEAQQEAGRVLRCIHEIEGNNPLYGGNDRWVDWMAGWLNHALHWWKTEGSGNSAEIESAQQAFDALRPLLTTRGHDFILFDGRPDHFIVQDKQLMGLIDVAEARTGDAAMDLGVLAVTDPKLMPGILAGYGTTSEEQVILDQLIPFYTFMRRLAMAEWDLEHGDGLKAHKSLKLLKRYPFPG